MGLLKFLIFSKIFRKTPNGLFSFLNFCNRMDVKKSQRAPLSQLSALCCEFSKEIVFVLKVGFLNASTLYPICFFFQRPVFFLCDFFLICFHRSRPQFLPETKRFASIKGCSRFSALCDLPETVIKRFSKKKFLNCLFFEMCSFEIDEFFAVSSWEEWFSRLMRIPSGIFEAVKLMKF